LVSKATAEVAGLKYILLSDCSSLEHANYIPVVWICVVPN
jgi:hypothetical protein